MSRKKWNIKTVKQECINRGYRPLFDEYKNNAQKLLVEMPEGYRVYITLQRLLEDVKPLLFYKSNEYSIDNLKTWLINNNRDIKVLSEQYYNNKNKMEFECPIHGAFFANLNSILLGHCCPACGTESMKTKRSFTIEHIKKKLKKINPNIELLTTKYMNNKTKLDCRCKICEYEWTTNWNSLSLGHGCWGCEVINRSGENSNLYNHDMTDEERKESMYKYRWELFGKARCKWAREVYKKGNYTCDCCKSRSGDIQAHHLDGYNWCKEKRFDINNGIVLCEDCHRKFHVQYGYGHNTEKQYIEFKQKYKIAS